METCSFLVFLEENILNSASRGVLLCCYNVSLNTPAKTGPNMYIMPEIKKAQTHFSVYFSFSLMSVMDLSSITDKLNCIIGRDCVSLILANDYRTR